MVQDWKGLLLKAIRVQGLVSVQWEAKADAENAKIKLKKDKEFVICVVGNRDPLKF